MYDRYAPEKLKEQPTFVDDTLQKCQGKEEKLMQRLVEKYGPEPKEGTGTVGAEAP